MAMADANTPQFLKFYTIVKPEQAGTCERSTKYHPRCQISIYEQFSL